MRKMTGVRKKEENTKHCPREEALYERGGRQREEGKKYRKQGREVDQKRWMKKAEWMKEGRDEMEAKGTAVN